MSLAVTLIVNDLGAAIVIWGTSTAGSFCRTAAKVCSNPSIFDSHCIDDGVLPGGFVFVKFGAIVLLSPSKSRTTLVAITANTHVPFHFITSRSPVVGIVQ
ncbi:hypothetical protein Zmor_017882 [Zophobas morio]|uniref:Uncharacterized protein n=1 Tax=Zophobas morio TaxID=2755281 RepID=A0AA38MDD5_9CUCU|nr:hypothetical protein Zmor_017882 [Zophobas morio]